MSAADSPFGTHVHTFCLEQGIKIPQEQGVCLNAEQKRNQTHGPVHVRGMKRAVLD